MMQAEMFTEPSGEAEFSEDRAFRYMLGRSWPADVGTLSGALRVLWVMLNPSTADAIEPDATIRRCISFSQREGAQSLAVVNLWPFIATHTKDLLASIRRDPLYTSGDPKNLHTIETEAERAHLIVCAWGATVGQLGEIGQARVRAVCDVLAHAQIPGALHRVPRRPLFSLGRTGGGHPCHPVRLAGSTPLELYQPHLL